MVSGDLWITIIFLLVTIVFLMIRKYDLCNTICDYVTSIERDFTLYISGTIIYCVLLFG